MRAVRWTAALQALFAAVLLLGATSLASAQDFPSRPITVVVPFSAGGPADLVMRILAEAAQKRLGQPIIVDNKAGGGGALGPATMALTARPDGHSIAMIVVPVYRLPLMQPTDWDAERDFTYIIRIGGFNTGIFAGASTPFHSWQDVIDFAKANPGKVTYASSGAGGSLHLVMELIASKAGIKLTHVPFKGTSEIATATTGGHTMLGMSGASMKPLADAGKIRFLNTWGDRRADYAPDAPTLMELGYDFVYDSAWGLAGPKGMDERVVARLHDAFKAAYDDPEVVAGMEKYQTARRYLNTADYRAFIPEAIKTERLLLDRAGFLKK